MKQILIKDGAVSDENCDLIIDWFNNNSDVQQVGKVGSERNDTSAKVSTDIPRWFRLQGTPEKPLQEALVSGGMQYHTERQHIFKTLSRMVADDSYVLQKYLPNEGFFSLHCEHTGPKYMSRILAWMVYLNDVPDGGTRFSEQDFNCEAKKGRLVIWPAYFTHMHKGIISPTHTKYIATGWITWDVPLD